MENKNLVKGGEFLTRDFAPDEIFIPEEFDEEQKMVAQTCEDFLEAEVFPNLDRIDKKEKGLMRSLIEKAGELGLLAISVPEEFEGFGQSFVTSMVACEIMGAAYSYAVAYSCHTGIGLLPILYYGNDQQKLKYLPKLSTGEWIGAYCLTEPGAGSDANSATTKAVPAEDGKYYLLNGQKMWITNGGFADVYTVFAKIENDRVLSAFIVEKDFPGMVINPEEEKMGIKGSSTVQIFFNDCKVPAENILGKRGEGFRIALNILHMGRIKLGANVVGAAKRAINHSVRYSNERKQFGSLISSFGAIQYKLAEQVIRTFVTESTVYRASKNIDEAIAYYLDDQGMEMGRGTMEAFNLFSIEAALIKVFASETLDYVIDEAVQIHGGMGFSSEMEVERGYRDSRINRIFEGTNEINRLIVVDAVMKRAARDIIPVFRQAERWMKELPGVQVEEPSGGDYYQDLQVRIKNFKKACIILMKAASDKFSRKLVFEQEILNNLSDMIMQVYAAESALLRVKKIEGMKGQEQAAVLRDILDVFVYDAAFRISKYGMDIIYSFPDPERAAALSGAFGKLVSTGPVNVRDARRRIAGKLIDENRYCF